TNRLSCRCARACRALEWDQAPGEQKGRSPMDVRDQQAGASRAAPPPFPVTWEDPEHAHVCWAQDSAWVPEPLTPLAGSLLADAVEPGFNAGWAAYEVPLRSWCRRINTYAY